MVMASPSPSSMQRRAISVLSLIFGAGLLTGGNSASAQDITWQPTNGPGAGVVECLAENSQGDVFAGTASDGVLRSTNSGQSWFQASNGLPNTEYFALTASATGYTFAGSWERGLYRSSDNGGSWSLTNIGLVDPTILSLCVSPTTGSIFAGTGGDGLYRSTDNGNHWALVLRYTPYPYTQVHSVLVTAQGIVFAGTDEGGIFRSTNNGQSWSQLAQSASRCLAANQPGVVYAGGIDGLFRSTNSGTTWTRIDNGFVNTQVMAVVAGSDSLVAAACFDGGVYCSTDKGAHWSHGTAGMTNTEMLSLLLKGGTIFVGTWGGLFRSTDGCLTWTQTGMPNARVYSILRDGAGSLVAGTSEYGLYRSTDNSAVWTYRSLLHQDILSLAIDQTGKLYAGIAEGGVYSSTNSGAVWYYAGVPSRFPRTVVVKQSNGFLFAGADSDGVFRSTDNGWEWVQVNNGLDNTDARALIVASSGDLLVGTRAGVYYSTNEGTDWHRAGVAGTDLDIQCISEEPSHLLFAGTAGGRILRSTDLGRDWTDAAANVTSRSISSFLTISNQLLFAGTLGDGVFLSTNSGDSWLAINEGLPSLFIRTLTMGNSGFLLAGSDSSGVFRTRQPVTSVNDAPWVERLSFSLLQNYPNPFNSSTRITYRLQSTSRVRLRIFNTLGQVIRTLQEGEQGTGYHQASWDGRNAAGLPVGSGVFYFQVEAVSKGGTLLSDVKKAILLK